MQIFLDTATIDEIEPFLNMGLVDGITTNPSLIAASGRDFKEVIKEFAHLIPGPISAEVTATDYETMVSQGQELSRIAPNVAIKVPLTYDGLRACYTLSKDRIMVNVTLCFSAGQALLAAKAGAAFVSPFVGRLDDIGTSGLKLIQDIAEIYRNYPETLTTRILAASIRTIAQVTEVARIGAHVVTLPPKILHHLFPHPLTNSGLEKFLSDWKASGQDL